MKLTINLDSKPEIGDELIDSEYSGTTIKCLENISNPYLFSMVGKYNQIYLTPGTTLHRKQPFKIFQIQ